MNFFSVQLFTIVLNRVLFALNQANFDKVIKIN